MSARFVVSPELFPARIAGEGWGAERVAIELAGERYVVDGLSSAQRLGLAETYGSRLRDPSERGRIATTLHVFRAPASDFVEIDTRGWEYALDLHWSETAVSMSGMRLMARADFISARAGLWTSVEDPAEFSGVLENVLRPIIAGRLLANGGLLVHSASVQGWLFPSPSGGGKSTIARMGLNAGLPVLSDDLNAVARGGTILPLPFTGELTRSELSAEPMTLRAIVALEKGGREAMRPLALAEAASLLVRCAPYVNQDPHRTALLLDRAAEIASGTPRAVLTFRRDENVWPILESLR